MTLLLIIKRLQPYLWRTPLLWFASCSQHGGDQRSTTHRQFRANQEAHRPPPRKGGDTMGDGRGGGGLGAADLTHIAHVHIYIYLFIYLYLQIQIHICIPIPIPIPMHMNIHIRKHTDMYTYMIPVRPFPPPLPPPMVPPSLWCGGLLPPSLWCGVVWGWVCLGWFPSSPPVAWCGFGFSCGGSPLRFWVCFGCLVYSSLR